MELAVPGVIEALENAIPLVTASPLLASAAAQQFAQMQIGKGATAWNRPPVFSLDAWLTSCWTEARYSQRNVPSLLSPVQELVVWEEAIRQEGTELFDPVNAARLARRTSRLVAEWGIGSADPAWNEQDDGLRFQAWSANVRRRCQAQGWMTRSELWSAIPAWMDANVCPVDPVALLGFNRISPGLQSIVSRLPNARILSSDATFRQEHAPPLARACETFEEELIAAARWARYQFESSPKSSLALFVPGLASHRTVVQRIFKRVFYPAAVTEILGEKSGLAGKDYAYHLNATAPLWEQPLVSHALLLLELAKDRIDHADATAILHSPFIRGAQRERSSRALADLALRRRRELDVNLTQLQTAASGCPELLSIFSEVRTLLQARPRTAETAQWSAFIGDLLQAVGWPGDREMSADDQDLVEVWKDALSELGSLSLVTAPMTLESAIVQLNRLLGRSRTELGDWFSPIQILDAAEASGLRFDRVFAVGMGDESWPPSGKPDPLIPLRLQRDYLLPESTPDLIHAERKRLTAGLLRSASEVCVTYTGRLSPLVGDLHLQRSDEWPQWTGRMPLQSFKPVKKETSEDTFAPPFQAASGVRGGTTVIKLQSACPFRAFAEIRLRSMTPENACFGLDARERGTFLHQAMQYIWEELKDRTTLKKLSDIALRELVERSAAKAVGESAQSELQVQTAEVERSRLSELIFDWLVTVERNRLLDFTVETTESALEFVLSGLPLKLRIDRMDRLANGQLVLIDYKSGSVAKGKLSCPRPEEPQLLVYAAAKDAQVDGLFFGQINREALKLPGISRDRHVKGNGNEVLNSKWEQRTIDWAAEVETRAAEFLGGYAAVDPSKCACDYCDTKPLCRIRERAAVGEADQTD